MDAFDYYSACAEFTFNSIVFFVINRRHDSLLDPETAVPATGLYQYATPSHRAQSRLTQTPKVYNNLAGTLVLVRHDAIDA